MAKKITLKVKNTKFRKVITYKNEAKLSGLIRRWLDDLEDKGQIQDGGNHKVIRTLVRENEVAR